MTFICMLEVWFKIVVTEKEMASWIVRIMPATEISYCKFPRRDHLGVTGKILSWSVCIVWQTLHDTLSLWFSMFWGQYLILVTRWWVITSISNLASSFPGQAWTPFPNGMNVYGFGAVYMPRRKIRKLEQNLLLVALTCRSFKLS